MTARYRHHRSHTPGAAFPTLGVGEVAANTANRQLAVGSAQSGSEGAPLSLIGVRIFDEQAQYAQNDYVVQGGCLQRAKGVVSPGVFSQAEWDALCPGTVGGNDTVEWTQAGHGYTVDDVGTPMYLAGTSWQPAIADSSGNICMGVLRNVVDANTITIQQVGYLTGIAVTLDEGGSMLVGQGYYLSSVNAGQITATAPSLYDTYVSPVYLALTATTALVLSDIGRYNGLAANAILVSQASHGFVAADRGRPVSYNSSWILGHADSNASTEVAALDRIIDTDTFSVVMSGKIDGISFMSLTPGNPYWVSPEVAGELVTGDEPRADRGYSAPFGFAIASDTLLIVLGMRRILPVYKEILLSPMALAIQRTGVDAPLIGNATLGDITIDYLAFGYDQDTPNDDRGVYTLPMPEDWDESAVDFTLHWIGSGSSTPGEGVRWRVGMMLVTEGVDLASGLTYTLAKGGTSTLLTSSNTLQVTEISNVQIQVEGGGSSKILMLQLLRDVYNAGDNMIGGALLLAVKMRYKTKRTELE